MKIESVTVRIQSAMKAAGAFDLGSPEHLAFQCKQEGLPEPTFEYKFHPKRKWRLDLAWVDSTGIADTIAVEVHGGTWRRGGGAHRGRGFERDLEKAREAMAMNIRVYAFTTDEVKDGTAVRFLKERVFS